MSALVAVQYQVTFEGELSQGALRALAENPAIRILFGAPVALDHPGGFTVWRTGTPLLLLAGTWIMIAAIRITRSEEDAGHWDLVLAGPIRAAELVRYCLVALTAAAAAISTGVGVAMVAAGTGTAGAVAYAAGTLGVTLTFATAGLAAAQVMPSRSAAVDAAVGFLGIALLLRMSADGVSAVAWSALAQPARAHRARGPLRRESRVASAGVGLLPGCVRGGRGSGREIAGLGRRLAVALHAPPTAHPASGLDGHFRGTSRTGADRGLDCGRHRLLSDRRRVDRLRPRLLGEESPVRRIGSRCGVFRARLGGGLAAALFSLLAIPSGLYAATRLGAFVRDEPARRFTMLFASPIPRARLLSIEIAVSRSDSSRCTLSLPRPYGPAPP